MKVTNACFLLFLSSLGVASVEAKKPVRPATITMDFEGLKEGSIVSEISQGSGATGDFEGTINVKGYRPKGEGKNSAMIFDSSCTGGCSGNDPDLGTPNEQFGGPGRGSGGKNSNKVGYDNILINTEDFDTSNPDDADEKGMYFDFDFTGVSGDVTMDSITYIDLEAEQGEDGVFVQIYSAGKTDPALFTIPPTGNNGVGTITGIKISNVEKVRFNQNGSGGLVEMAFGTDEPGECWSTTGGFQNAGLTSGSKSYTFGGNVGPNPSGSWEVVDHETGDNFHSNSVSVTECGVVSGLTGPNQPGGKKGFKINLLKFEGTGRLRSGTDGSVTEDLYFTGCVMDAGEPAGKKDFDKDYFEIVVCKEGDTNCMESGLCDTMTTVEELVAPHPQVMCDGLDAVFAACGSLDGGNVQLHPPSGKP